MAYNKKSWKNNESGDTPISADSLNDLETRIKEGFDEKVKKNGDTMSGPLTIITNFFEGFIKERTINNIVYQLKLGISNKNNQGGICIQLMEKNTDNFFDQIDAMPDGTLKNGITNKNLLEEDKQFGSISLEQGITNSGYLNKIVIKNGRVNINLSLNGKLTNSSNWIKLGTISAESRPTNTVFTVAFVDMIGKSGCPIRIESNGVVSILDNQTNTNACIRFSISYDNDK